MKANELMVGDWVYNSIADITFQVYPQFFSQWHNRPEQFEATIQPILLTPEILEKNGFVFDGTNRWDLHESRFDAFVVPVQPDNEWWDKYSTRIEVCTPKADLLIEAVEQIFVHQLQQFLRHCGIEKEIEL